jgi:hypothetical protein
MNGLILAARTIPKSTLGGKGATGSLFTATE